MAKFIIKWALLSVFGLILFILLRLGELFGAYDPSYMSLRFIDPFTLSVRKLKLLLDQRGVGYNQVVEKSELDNLVEISGKVSEADTASALNSDLYSPIDHVTDFVGQEHFYELVEDSKDSAWLILVTPEDGPPLLSLRSWKHVTRKLSRFGVRAGEIDCSTRLHFCARRGFDRAMLILALPQGHRVKEQVALTSFPHSGDGVFSAAVCQKVLDWVRAQLTARIRPLESVQELDSNWLGRKIPEVVVVMLARKSHDPTPMLLSALSVKFNGRTKFWRVNVDEDPQSKALSEQLLANYELKSPTARPPSIMIIDGPPENSKARIYGDRSGEPLSYTAMELYLRTLTPEANDIFLLCLLLIQLTGPLAFSLRQGGFLKRLLAGMLTLLWTNAVFLLLCLPVIGLFSLNWMQSVLALFQRCTRRLAQTSAADCLRRDLLSGVLNPVSFLVIYSIYIIVVAVIEWWRTGGVDTEAELPSTGFQELPGTAPGVLSPSPFLTQYQPIVQHDLDLESGMQALLTSLSSPAIWLPASVPQPDYLHQLPIWKYEFLSEEEECAICLEIYSSGVSICGLPCGHNFHEACVMKWLIGSQHACPVCRWPPYKPKEKQQ